jgi:hypothetical protein
MDLVSSTEMKIAICYSGQNSRFYRDRNILTQQLKKFSENSEIDIFFSLWNDSKQLQETENDIKNCIQQASNEKISLIKIELENRITPTSKYKHEHLWSKANSIPNTISMFTGIKNADKLRQQHEDANNFKYDLVIRSRPDVGLEGNIDYNEIKHILENDALAVFPKDYNWFNCWSGNCGMLNDQCFIALSDTMSQITNINVEKCWDDGARVQPESALWWWVVNEVPLPEHLKSKEIPWYKFLHFMTVLRGGRELVSSIAKFEKDNVTRFKLDKILSELGISINV